ncbi:MAG: IclR family transcriptional regulator [Proteobacteria bacterium]|nr:IclR family transcriptional regulator [Pseudomonadota bacterium]
MQSERNKLNSIEKALSILKVFDSNRPYWGVREISSHLGFSPSTVQRLLQTLKDYSYVEQNPETRQYRLGNIYFQFIFTLQNASPLTETAQLFMRQLLSKTQETVHLNVIDGTERLCIDSIESSQSLKASMPIGSRSPLYAGASSKCLLAYSESDFVKQYLKTTKIKAITANTIVDKHRLLEDLEQIKSQGFAESLGERNPGLGSFSSAILGRRGEVLASVSLAIPEIRFQVDEHRKLCISELTKIAKEISKAMGSLGS